MIARMWHGRIDRDRADEYVDYVRETGVKDLRKTGGNQGVMVLCDEVGDGGADILVISFWDALESIRAFAGDNLLRARYYPRDAEFLHELEPEVRHFEVRVDES